MKRLSLCVILMFIGLAPLLNAADPKDEYRRIQRDLDVHKKRLENVQKKEQSVINELRKVQAELTEIEGQLANQRKKIQGIQQKITKVQQEIKTYSFSLDREQNLLKRRLRAIQRKDMEKDLALIILSGADIVQSVRAMKYLKDISAYDHRLILAYKGSLKTLSIEQTELKRLHDDLRAEERNLAKMEEAATEKKKEREQLLVSVRKEKKAYEKMVAELQDASNRLLKLIQEAEKREREQRQQRRAQTKPGEKEEAVGDTEFAKHKGRLPWPVQGTVAMQYGSQVDPIFNLPVFRSGIHIKTSHGATIKAVHEGKVVYASEFKGYGQLVILSHGGGYHSLYGNLSKITVKNGADVKEQQVIGEAGESNTIGSPGLYFEIRYKGKPLDPQQWLRR